MIKKSQNLIFFNKENTANIVRDTFLCFVVTEESNVCIIVTQLLSTDTKHETYNFQYDK